jgi:uncharacterized protein (DUF1330 family)
MAAYVIGEIEITNPAAYEDYKKSVAPVLQKFGGKFLARGGKVVPLEGNWDPKRLVIVEFESMQRALAWYNSPEYAPVKAMRQAASSGNQLIVEGV